MQRFTDDCENRLIHAQTWHGATLHSEARYHYDALGRSIAKEVTQSGQPQKTTFLWQDDLRHATKVVARTLVDLTA